jgi:hypothetical protein
MFLAHSLKKNPELAFCLTPIEEGTAPAPSIHVLHMDKQTLRIIN